MWWTEVGFGKDAFIATLDPVDNGMYKTVYLLTTLWIVLAITLLVFIILCEHCTTVSHSKITFFTRNI